MAIRLLAGSRYWTSLLSVTALAACTATPTASKCEKYEPGTTTCQDLMNWLEHHGADTRGLGFRSSEVCLFSVMDKEFVYAVGTMCCMSIAPSQLVRIRLDTVVPAEYGNRSVCNGVFLQQAKIWRFLAHDVSIRTAMWQHDPSIVSCKACYQPGQHCG